MKNIKTCILTGYSGFIGHHLCKRLLDDGWIVYGIDKNMYTMNSVDLFNYNNFIHIGDDICTIKELPDCDYIFNLAAESHVGNSIECSKNFIYSNVDGVRNLLDCIRKKPDNVTKKPVFFHFSCFDKETRAVTKNGLKYFWELSLDDEIVSINPKTKNIEFKKIEKIIIQDYSGDMIHFNHKSDDLLVTPNHRVFFENSSGKIDKKEAWEVLYKTNIKYPRGKVKEDNNLSYYVENIGDVNINDLFFVSGVFIGDGFLATQVSKKKSKTGLDREQYLKWIKENKSKNGKFLSPGKIGENNYSKDTTCYRIFFDVPENDKCRKKLEQSLTNLNINWSSHKGKSGEHIYFSSKEWSKYFEQFGKYAKNKTIPDWMFNYSYSQLFNLYDGLILSDGYYKKNKNGTETGVLTTISKCLMEKTLILGTMLGFHTRFDKIKVDKENKIFYKKENRNIIQKNDVYYIHFNNQDVFVGNGKFSIKQYNDKIWCLTIPDNKNFLVERNGITKISGNTDEVYGDRLEFSADEADILNPSNPYSASKAAADMLILAWARTYDLEYVIVRPTNNYGTHQSTEKLIPLSIKLALSGKPIRLHNRGVPKRMWLHVLDTVDAVLTLVDKNARGIYNISGNIEQTNLSTVYKILKSMNIEPTDDRFDLSYVRQGQDMRYSVNDSKLKDLGWKCKRHFDDEIKNIIDWYLKDPIDRLFTPRIEK